jgi:hypothetical protein
MGLDSKMARAAKEERGFCYVTATAMTGWEVGMVTGRVGKEQQGSTKTYFEVARALG